MARAATGEFLVHDLPCSWVRDGTLAGRPLVLLAHGAGAPLDSTFMAGTADGLVGRGLCVARFHFPYMERRVREGTRRPPDRAPRLIATWRAMIDVARRWRNRGPIVVAGKSMGGRMASMLLAAGDAPEAVGAVWFGYPLHPPGKPEKLRADHLPDVPVPQLFLSGTKDPLCDLSLLRHVLRRIGASARLETVEGGDHSLAVKRSAPVSGSAAWLDAAAEFVHEVASRRA
jgi:predicted alpha/beta-hydrolase family hydrolase